MKTIITDYNISSNLIKELRRRTNISIVQCKKALIQSNGDIELAIDNIRKFGLEVAERKSKRTAISGIIITKISENKQRGVVIEINCETDFVARENGFKEFADTVVTTILHEDINDIDILNNMFQSQRANLIAKVGENIKIRRFSVLNGNYISGYTHISKIGVIISINQVIIAQEALIKNIAMHIIAKNPKFIHVNNIPKDVIMREYHIQKSIAMDLGKSQDILEKIITGRMNKFFNEIVLLQQNFLLDINKTVDELLNENNLQIYDFVRFELGNYNK